MYVMDYGAPIGYRLALLHPERVQGLIVQNGKRLRGRTSRVFGIRSRKYWANPTPENRARVCTFLSDPKVYQVAIRDWGEGYIHCSIPLLG